MRGPSSYEDAAGTQPQSPMLLRLLLIPGPDRLQDLQKPSFVAQYAEQLRLVPLAAGACGFILLLVNRFGSGAMPVLDAGSSQSRVDVLIIILAATLALNGLQWLALTPAKRTTVSHFRASSSRDSLPFQVI
jgi:hypothetical protein